MTWKPIPGFSGYEASDSGEVRSLRRKQPRVLTGSTVGPCGFRTVSVNVAPGHPVVCRRIGTLVALAWLGPPPKGRPEVRRIDGDTLNDRPSNLAYGTAEEVAQDYANRARREEANGAPTHCPSGHRYADSWEGAFGDRLCRECRWESHRRDSRRLEIKRRSWKQQAERDARRQDPASVDLSRETVRTVTCGCGVEMIVSGRGATPTRCPDCRRQAQRDADRRWRVNHQKPPKVRLYRCECGATMTATGSGPPWKRCPDCTRRVKREKDAQRRAERKAGAS